jgi:hypothetical protein
MTSRCDTFTSPDDDFGEPVYVGDQTITKVIKMTRPKCRSAPLNLSLTLSYLRALLAKMPTYGPMLSSTNQSFKAWTHGILNHYMVPPSTKPVIEHMHRRILNSTR